MWNRALSSRQITDAYLLALAVQQDGRFITLDQGIPLDLVSGALREHLTLISYR